MTLHTIFPAFWEIWTQLPSYAAKMQCIILILEVSDYLSTQRYFKTVMASNSFHEDNLEKVT